MGRSSRWSGVRWTWAWSGAILSPAPTAPLRCRCLPDRLGVGPSASARPRILRARSLEPRPCRSFPIPRRRCSPCRAACRGAPAGSRCRKPITSAPDANPPDFSDSVRLDSYRASARMARLFFLPQEEFRRSPFRKGCRVARHACTAGHREVRRGSRGRLAPAPRSGSYSRPATQQSPPCGGERLVPASDSLRGAAAMRGASSSSSPTSPRTPAAARTPRRSRRSRWRR